MYLSTTGLTYQSTGHGANSLRQSQSVLQPEEYAELSMLAKEERRKLSEKAEES